MRFLSNVKSRSRNPTVGQPLGIFICQSKIQSISPMSNAALSCEGRLQKSLLLQVRPYKARKMHKPCLFQGRGNAHTTQGKNLRAPEVTLLELACQHQAAQYYQAVVAVQPRVHNTHLNCNLCLRGTEPQRELPALLVANPLLLCFLNIAIKKCRTLILL